MIWHGMLEIEYEIIIMIPFHDDNNFSIFPHVMWRDRNLSQGSPLKSFEENLNVLVN